MRTDNNILAVFDEEYEELATAYQIEEIPDDTPTSMIGGGGGGGGGR